MMGVAQNLPKKPDVSFWELESSYSTPEVKRPEPKQLLPLNWDVKRILLIGFLKTSGTVKSPLSNLPKEVIAKVFSYIDAYTINQFQNVVSTCPIYFDDCNWNGTYEGWRNAEACEHVSSGTLFPGFDPPEVGSEYAAPIKSLLKIGFPTNTSDLVHLLKYIEKESRGKLGLMTAVQISFCFASKNRNEIPQLKEAVLSNFFTEAISTWAFQDKNYYQIGNQCRKIYTYSTYMDYLSTLDNKAWKEKLNFS